ncbi:hypothetical protein N7488_000315 [Penicillium malachiteum]|nr:hypothetical protein N7488_000315 [Penicillium malachiteum]
MKDRYFLLDETIPAKEISRMMCRVVVDKLLPLHHFAPSEPSSTEEPSHHTNDIIPDILPEPCISTSRQDFVTSVHRSEIVSTLTTYLGLDLSRENQQSVSLHSDSVKRFTLSNPESQFDRLVANPLYARDVFNLLQKARLGKAYLVVGFLTVTGAVWQHKRNREHSERGTIGVPVGDLVGIGIGSQAGLDAGLRLGNTQGTCAQFTMHISEEEIFAIAYCEVKVKREFTRNAPHFVKKTLAFGQAKRNKGHHLTFGHDDDEVEPSSEEEDAIEKVKIMIVPDDHADEPKISCVYEAGEFTLS